MRYVLTVVFILNGGAAIGLAILAGLWGVLKGGDDAEEEIEEELEEEVA